MTVPLPEHVIPVLSRGTVDRAAHRRTDQSWLDAAWDDPRSRVLAVRDGRFPVYDEAAGPRLAVTAPADAPATGERFFLGEDADGAVHLAVSGEPPRAPDPAAGPATRLVTLRDVGSTLGDGEAGLAVHAVALDNWHATHVRCPRCGAATRSEQGGHARRCPADGSVHFPRTDPAVIMLVHDGAGRCLLGRGATWPERRFSALAGFVEAGESAEQAVVREVAEEVGLAVTDVEYRASQPWPFPSSLMLGFRARALAADVTADLNLCDGEIAEARWFTREELTAAATQGWVLRPPAVSIAHRLISDWLEGR